MASVRLGRDTRRLIHRTALKAYDTTVVEPVLDNETIESVWQGIVEHPAHVGLSNFVTTHGALYKQLADSDIQPRRSDKVVLYYGHGNQDSEDFELPTERNSWIRRAYSHHHVNLRDLHLSEEERMRVKDKITDLAERRKKARNDRRNYDRQIDDLLDSCNTLKQLLDAQPSMKEFVPDELLRDLHKKVTRESQARERREIAQVDGDLINRVVLTSKLVA